jgi:hypothetical protein
MRSPNPGFERAGLPLSYAPPALANTCMLAALIRPHCSGAEARP